MIVAAMLDGLCPPEKMRMAERLATLIADRRWWIRSGHDQNDVVFERGALQRCIVYLPTREWGPEKPSEDVQTVVYSEMMDSDREAWEMARLRVSEYERSMKTLPDSVKDELARIWLIIMGKGAKPVDVFFCHYKKPKSVLKAQEEDEEELDELMEEDFAPDGEDEESEPDIVDQVSFALKIAEDYDIPIINIGESIFRSMSEEDLMEYIERLCSRKRLAMDAMVAT